MQKALQLQGALAEVAGDLDAAARLHEEALRLARSIGNRRAVTGQLGNLGWVFFQREDYDAAEAYFIEALDVISPSDLENRAYMHGNLGMIALLCGNGSRASEELALCLGICGKLGMLRIAAEALTALAALAADEGETERAVTLWAAAVALHETSGSTPSVLEEQLRAKFLEPVAQILETDGRVRRPMTLDQSVAYALRGEG